MNHEECKPGSRTYLIREIMTLRHQWGFKTFWSDLERADRALRALVWQYANTPGATIDDAILIQSTITEFARRRAWAVLHLPTRP